MGSLSVLEAIDKGLEPGPLAKFTFSRSDVPEPNIVDSIKLCAELAAVQGDLLFNPLQPCIPSQDPVIQQPSQVPQTKVPVATPTPSRAPQPSKKPKPKPTPTPPITSLVPPTSNSPSGTNSAPATSIAPQTTAIPISTPPGYQPITPVPPVTTMLPASTPGPVASKFCNQTRGSKPPAGIFLGGTPSSSCHEKAVFVVSGADSCDIFPESLQLQAPPGPYTISYYAAANSKLHADYSNVTGIAVVVGKPPNLSMLYDANTATVIVSDLSNGTSIIVNGTSLTYIAAGFLAAAPLSSPTSLARRQVAHAGRRALLQANQCSSACDAAGPAVKAACAVTAGVNNVCNSIGGNLGDGLKFLVGTPAYNAVNSAIKAANLAEAQGAYNEAAANFAAESSQVDSPFLTEAADALELAGQTLTAAAEADGVLTLGEVTIGATAVALGAGAAATIAAGLAGAAICGLSNAGSSFFCQDGATSKCNQAASSASCPPPPPGSNGAGGFCPAFGNNSPLNPGSANGPFSLFPSFPAPKGRRHLLQATNFTIATAALQAALKGFVPAENITILDVLSTGGSDNYPYTTTLDNADAIGATMEAMNAPMQTLIQFYYPASLQSSLQAAIDNNSLPLSQGNITTISLTQAPCDASPTGICFPGFVCCNQLGRPCCPAPSAAWLQPGTLNQSTPTMDTGESISVQGPGYTNFTQPNPSVAVGPGHVVMIVDGALDVRCKDNIDNPLLYTDLSSFFSTGTGYNLTLPYDVTAMWDTLNQRYVLWTIDRDIIGGYLQDYFAVAVSKSADPMMGWNYMLVNASMPYSICRNYGCTSTVYYKYSFVDSPRVGFSADQLYVVATVAASNITTTSFSIVVPSSSGYSHALWTFPKTVNNGQSVYDGNVLLAQEGLHYQLYDLPATTGVFSTTPVVPSRLAVGQNISADINWLVALQDNEILIYRVDNTTTGAGQSLAAQQTLTIPHTLLSPFDYVSVPASVSQKGAPDFPLTANQAALIFPVTFKDSKLYFTFQTAGVPDPSNGNINTVLTKYVVLNVASTKIGPTKFNSNFRTLTGAFVESYGTLNMSSLGPLTSAFYPVLTVDATGYTGLSFSVSSSSLYPGAYFSCFNASSPNVTSLPLPVKTGEGPFGRCVTLPSGPFGIDETICRWGDYSGIAMDPDGLTFWVFNSYGQQNNAWGTWLAAFQCSDVPAISASAAMSNMIQKNGTFSQSVASQISLGAQAFKPQWSPTHGTGLSGSQRVLTEAGISSANKLFTAQEMCPACGRGAQRSPGGCGSDPCTPGPQGNGC